MGYHPLEIGKRRAFGAKLVKNRGATGQETMVDPKTLPPRFSNSREHSMSLLANRRRDQPVRITFPDGMVGIGGDFSYSPQTVVIKLPPKAIGGGNRKRS